MANEEYKSLVEQMLPMLKDISSYLSKQDATMERAKIDMPPEMQETQAPIEGGKMPGTFKPGEGIAKEFVEDPKANSKGEELDSEGSTMLKEDDDEEEARDKSEVEEDEKGEDVEELKSLLKDIRSALIQNSDVAQMVKSEFKKAVPDMVKSETDKMLRKMGFTPTRPDVKRLGLDINSEVKKSEDELDIKKGEGLDKKVEEAYKIVEDLSGKSWGELGQLREKAGLFTPFPRD